MRAIVGALPEAGHVFPAIALGRELAARGHEVTLQTTAESWREPVEAAGLTCSVIPAHVPASGRDKGGGATLADVVGELVPAIGAERPDVIVNDVHGYAHALVAEQIGIPLATLIPGLYPVFEPGLPPYPLGVAMPRTRLGKGLWRAAATAPAGWLLRRGRAQLNGERAKAGLAPTRRFNSQISAELALVATFPQLEYPRRWPGHVHLTGPLFHQAPAAPVRLPDGDDPLVAVASSTVFDPQLRLVRVALEALAGEPVRVVAALNRPDASWDAEVPPNAVVVGWPDYGQLIAAASLVVTTGGHGTVTRALAVAKPLLVCPAAADQAENGARVAWAGAGLMLPRRLLGPRALRATVRRILAERSFAARAGELAAWEGEHDPPRCAAELVESLAEGTGG